MQLRSGSSNDGVGEGGQDSISEWTGFFLGDVKWGATNAHNGFGVMTRSGRLLVLQIFLVALTLLYLPNNNLTTTAPTLLLIVTYATGGT